MTPDPLPMTERAPRDGTVGEAAQSSLLRIDGVSKYYGPVCAIDNVTLAIKNREFFCLLGPSGCGKTTLMRVLAGLDDVSQGRILLDDGDITKVPPHKRPVNMMFQSYALFPHLTAVENIAFGLGMESIGKAQTAERVHGMLRLLKLEGLEARKPHQLSGGQQQRVALARALVKQPRILLLDEPLGALDRKLREETQFELKALQTRLGTAFVVVTHDQKEAMVLADRIAIMNAGYLVQVGSPRELYEKPATSFAAELLGNINLFAAQVRAIAGDRMDVEFAGGLMSMSREADARPGQMVTIGVRPEKFEFFSASTPSRQRVKLAGVIAESAYFGDATTYRVKLDCDPLVQIAIPNRQRLTHDSHAVGDRVTLSVASENCISFLNERPKA